MPYSRKIVEAVNQAPCTLGANLGKWAIRRDLSMQRVAVIVGVSRQTVYNWFTGSTEVTQACQERVTDVIAVLKNTSQTEDAWRVLCKQYNIKL